MSVANITLVMSLAWRNLWRHSRRTWLTVGAMVFCNALLVFAVSTQQGSYQSMIENSLNLFTGQLQVQHREYLAEPKLRFSIPAATALAAQLRESLRAAGAFPELTIATRASAFALASSDSRSFGLQISGVEPSREPSLSTLPGQITQGRYLANIDAAEIVIGSVLARNLKVSIGDEITLLGSGRDGSFAAGFATVVGIFNSGVNDIDRGMTQMPLGYFQSLFAMDDHAHSIVISSAKLTQAAALQQQTQILISDLDPLTARDWDALLPGLNQAIMSDMLSAGFIYLVLAVLVAFSVLNTQLMSVLERTREFGILTALGVRPGQLSALVVLETVIMAVIGLTLGIAVGFVLTSWFSYSGIAFEGMEEVANKFNMAPRLYPKITGLSLTIGPLVVFVGCMLAAIYPALRLLAIEPVEAMRAA